jgi:hypothetical protein
VSHFRGSLQHPGISGTHPKLNAKLEDQEKHGHRASRVLPRGTHNHRVLYPDQIFGRDKIFSSTMSFLSLQNITFVFFGSTMLVNADDSRLSMAA